MPTDGTYEAEHSPNTTIKFKNTFKCHVHTQIQRNTFYLLSNQNKFMQHSEIRCCQSQDLDYTDFQEQQD